MPAHQLPGALGGVPDVEQLADQRLDPAQGPALVPGEPVRQRAFPSSSSSRAHCCGLSRSRDTGPFDRSASVPAVLPGPVPPPHRPFGDPQVVRDLADPVAAGEPPRGLQPQPLTPLLLGGRIPAPLRIPHALVILRQPADVTT